MIRRNNNTLRELIFAELNFAVCADFGPNRKIFQMRKTKIEKQNGSNENCDPQKFKIVEMFFFSTVGRL